MSIIPTRPLGSQGLMVSAQGLGCMGMTAFYGTFDRDEQESENLRTIEKGLEQGINFLDTAWIYQSFGQDGKANSTNEDLIGRAIAKFGRDKFIIATKFGITPSGISGSKETILSQLEDSLSRLGTSYIDLYYQHRMDPNTPIEETMTVLKSLVEAGKIRYIGLSECSASELRRAHAVHPISAIQMEWSLQTRELEAEVVPCARELGVGIVPYSPLGRGFLAQVNAFDSLDEKDWRKSQPRWSGENYEENKRLVARFFDMARDKGCTPAQLALAWVHAQGEDVFPIPGTKSSARIEENARAFTLLPLSPEELRAIEESVAGVAGERYNEQMMKATHTGRL